MVVRSDVVIQCDLCDAVVKHQTYRVRIEAIPYARHGEMLYESVRDEEADICYTCVNGEKFQEWSRGVVIGRKP